MSFTSCNETKNPVGSQDVDELSDLTFEITQKKQNSYNTQLIVIGNVTNHGRKLYPEWIIECDFYTDSTFVYKLGGNYTTMGYSLDKNETTSWMIKFSSEKYDESEYPDFDVKNIRAYVE